MASYQKTMSPFNTVGISFIAAVTLLGLVVGLA
jgi:hypothetical protein